MQLPKALSYSSFSLWCSDQDEFYMRYLADNRAPRLLQDQPAAVGSAFDAFVKSALATELSLPGLTFPELFEAQVEPHQRDFALAAGEHTFGAYVACKAYDDLLDWLRNATDVRFEAKLDGIVEGIPIHGRPDLSFRWNDTRAVLDWKVRGSCSKSNTSPSKGYALCRWLGDPKRAKAMKHEQAHPLYEPYEHRGVVINKGHLEHCHKPYAEQLSIYNWLLGGEINHDTTFCIEELCGYPTDKPGCPTYRYARHRSRIQPEFQRGLLDQMHACWDALTSGHVFTALSREDSDARCNTLDALAESLAKNLTPDDEWMARITRGGRKFK